MVFYCVYVIRIPLRETCLRFPPLLPPSLLCTPILVLALYCHGPLSVCLLLSFFLTGSSFLSISLLPGLHFVSNLLLGLSWLLMPEACIYNTHCHKVLVRMIDFLWLWIPALPSIPATLYITKLKCMLVSHTSWFDHEQNTIIKSCVSSKCFVKNKSWYKWHHCFLGFLYKCQVGASEPFPWVHNEALRLDISEETRMFLER